jgi:hypothetical protein
MTTMKELNKISQPIWGQGTNRAEPARTPAEIMAAEIKLRKARRGINNPYNGTRSLRTPLIQFSS